MKKRLVAVLIILMMLSGLTTSVLAESAQAPLKISMLIMGGPKTPDSNIEKIIEKTYNVDLDLIFLPGWDDKDVKTNLLMSSPDTMPDVIWWNDMDKEFKEWKDAGLIVDMLPYLKEYGSNILEYYSKDTLFFSYDNGHIYKLPGDVAEESTGTIVMRGDWLNSLNLPVPTTLDELVDTLIAFTKNDPDKNGLNDTVGLGTLSVVYQTCGVNIDGFMLDENGKVTYGSIMPGAKDALRVLNKLYTEGAIEPLIFANAKGLDYNQEIEAWTGGKVGCMAHGVHHFNPSSSLNKAFYANNPGAEMISVDPLIGPNGVVGITDVQDIAGWCKVSITSNAKDPARIVSFFNDLMSPEGFKLYKFGVEGTHYEIVDGAFKPLMSQSELDAEGVNLLCWYFERKDAANIQNTTQVNAMFEHKKELSKPTREKTVFFKDNNRAAWSEYRGDLETLRDTTFSDIILGNQPIDAFDAFVEQWLASGGQAVLDEANELYARQAEELATFDKDYQAIVN